jgi:hypothetical protein
MAKEKWRFVLVRLEVERKFLMRFPDISKRPWMNIDLMICGFLGMLDGLILFFSLGFVQTGFEMSYIVWRTERMCIDRKDEKDKKKRFVVIK